jgi:hypothetical protein
MRIKERVLITSVGDPDPEPAGERSWIRISTKMSRIPNTAHSIYTPPPTHKDYLLGTYVLYELPTLETNEHSPLSISAILPSSSSWFRIKPQPQGGYVGTCNIITALLIKRRERRSKSLKREAGVK